MGSEMRGKWGKRRSLEENFKRGQLREHLFVYVYIYVNGNVYRLRYLRGRKFGGEKNLNANISVNIEKSEKGAKTVFTSFRGEFELKNNNNRLWGLGGEQIGEK